MKSPLMSSKSGGKALCSVCGDESSGFHYGVDSCEGCKGFFRRCITQGMNHKCTNEEKCDITPFTRNSCQYCRLKKCFEVGMSREASRLGRRPKRMKEVGGEGSGGSRAGNLPIAPYPAPQDMNRMRMEDLQRVLQSSGSVKEDLMQALLTVAKASFQEHSKTGDKGRSHELHQELKTAAMVPNPSQVLTPVAGGIPTTSSMVETHSAPADSGGQGGGGIDVDSPSSLHSPGRSSVTDLNLGALDSFLFDQGTAATPGSSHQVLLDSIADLQALNSPHNSSSLGLDSLSAATSPVSDLGVGSPLILPPSSSCTITNGGGGLESDSSLLQLAGGPLCTALPTPAASAQNSAVSGLQTSGLLPHHQYLHPLAPMVERVTSPKECAAEAKPGIKAEPKTEPGVSFSTSCSVKTEPVSPVVTSMRYPLFPVKSHMLEDLSGIPPINVKAIMEEVHQTPSENRRLLIEQVTDAVVEAHISTTLNTHKAIEEANQRIQVDFNRGPPNKDPARVKEEADYMWHQFVSSMVPEITKVVKFCKKLPGFVEIAQDDQIQLIKQGAFEVMMTRFALLVDIENQTLLDPTLTSRCPRHVILATPMGGFLDEFFYVAARFKPLKLTDGEVGLFTSNLIVCPSRKGLKSKLAISKIQSLYRQALYILMKHNHPDAEERFAALMELTTTFRRINDEHFKAISDIRLTMPNSAKFPELHREIFDCSD